MKSGVIAMLLTLLPVGVMAQSEDVLRPNGRPGGGGDNATSSSSSKLPFIIGIEGGINANIFNGSLEGTLVNSPLNAYQNGSGFSPLVGLYVEVPLSSRISVGMRMLYDPKSFGNAVDNAEQQCEDRFQGGFALTKLTYEWEETIDYITINPVIRWEPVDRFFIHLGPSLQFAIDSVSRTKTATINDGEDCWFYDDFGDSSKVNSVTMSGTAENSFRFGVDLGIGYRLPLAPSIDLVPRVGYQWMLTKYGADAEDFDTSQEDIPGVGPVPYTFTNITLSSIQASLSLWIHL